MGKSSRRERRRQGTGQVSAAVVPPRAGADSAWPEKWLVGLLLAIAILVFAPSVRNEFTFDDLDVIVENERLDHPTELGLFFSTSWWGEAQPDARLYRPLTLATLAWDRALFGPGPRGTHVVNVLLNAFVAWLVFLLGRTLGLGLEAAFACALLFAVHPVHVEVVSTGVGRADLLAAAFLFGGALLHLRWQRSSLTM